MRPLVRSDDDSTDDVGERGGNSKQCGLNETAHENECEANALFIRCAEWLGYRRP